MAYTRKTKDYWSIQQYTGGQFSWEEVNAEETWKDAKRSLKEYRENKPQYPVRARRKREKIEPSNLSFAAEKQLWANSETVPPSPCPECEQTGTHAEGCQIGCNEQNEYERKAGIPR
jgi:hypothetical protein